MKETFFFVKDIKKTYYLFNILSLDVALGAAISSLFFADFFGVPPSTTGTLVLGLTVWLVYTADHLMDARKMRAPTETSRHTFHRRHFKVLAGAAGVVALTNVALIFNLPLPMIKAGMGLGIFVIGYLLLINKWPLLKEVFAAALYSLGILVPVGMVCPLNLQEILLIVQFFFAALMNLIIFSWFDLNTDARQGTRSGVQIMGKRVAVPFFWVLFGLNSVIFLSSSGEMHFLLLWMVALGNVMLLVFQDKVRAGDQFRLIGDALFLIPGLSLI